MADSTSKHGCGVFSAVFGRRTRRSVSTSSLPNVDVPQVLKTTSKQKSDSRRRNGSDGGFSDYSSTTEEPQRSGDRIISRPSPNHKRKVTPPVYVQPQQQEVKKTAPNAKVGSAGPKIGQNGQQHFQSYNCNKRVPQGSTGISGELEAMIDEQRSAYAGNMKVYGNLGNLRQGNSNNINNKPKTEQKERSLPNGMGNITRKPSKESHTPTKPNSYCRALSTRMDPEQLKIMGNEDYKNGRFAEALSLYDAAIFLDPEKASYRSNKSAALTSLGRLLEAVFEAREAIRIEPSYERAHNRLATLYLRLGDPDQTTSHYKQAGSEADPDLIIKAKKLQQKSAGADPALRHHEADQVLSSAPKFEEEDCTKFYGPVCHANLLVVSSGRLAAGGPNGSKYGLLLSHLVANSNINGMTITVNTKTVYGGEYGFRSSIGLGQWMGCDVDLVLIQASLTLGFPSISLATVSSRSGSLVGQRSTCNCVCGRECSSAASVCPRRRTGAVEKILACVFEVSGAWPFITSLKCVLTQEHLDAICAKYFVPEEVHPQLPSSDATMHERPTGKVGMYTRFFDYANYRIPFSTFFVSVLTHFRIPFSQLSVFGSAK
ncbi:inactive TPR repeat-containing thioredoxin TTL3-like protein, partial [Tanacetum coccineum]